MQSHVLYPRRRELVRNGLTLWCAFRLRDICIEFSVHQDLSPVRSIPDGCNDVLYGQGVSGGNIAPHDMPPPPPRYQLKSDDVQAVEAELLDSEVLRLAVKNINSATLLKSENYAMKIFKLFYVLEFHFR